MTTASDSTVVIATSRDPISGERPSNTLIPTAQPTNGQPSGSPAIGRPVPDRGSPDEVSGLAWLVRGLMALAFVAFIVFGLWLIGVVAL